MYILVVPTAVDPRGSSVYCLSPTVKKQKARAKGALMDETHTAENRNRGINTHARASIHSEGTACKTA